MLPLENFEFLIGDWISPMSGEPGQGVAGSCTFTFELDKNIILRKSRAEFAPKLGEKKGLVHDDLLIIFQKPEESFVRAIYFDNEGHTLHYTVDFPAKGPGAIFETDPTRPGPRFRLVYSTDHNGDLWSDFQVGVPGGEFQSHVKGKLQRP
jgi:hypothetical protein